MEPIGAFTIAIGPAAAELARGCRATFKAFHPEIPFHVIDEEAYLWFARQDRVANPGEIMSMRTLIGHLLSRRYRRLIYLDADTIVFGRLDALVDSTAPLTVTRDLETPFPGALPINAGVLAASGTEVWRIWMTEIYSRLILIVGNFLDQYALRELCREGRVGFEWVPERERRVFYNFSVAEWEGEWSGEDGVLRRGDAVVKIWHFAGKWANKGWQHLPPAAARLAEEHRERGMALDRAEAESDALNRWLGAREAEFLAETEAFFRALPTRIDDVVDPAIGFLPGYYIGDAPAAWDQFRNLAGTGIERRLLGSPRCYLYTRGGDPDRLWVEGLDPGWAWNSPLYHRPLRVVPPAIVRIGACRLPPVQLVRLRRDKRPPPPGSMP